MLAASSAGTNGTLEGTDSASGETGSGDESQELSLSSAQVPSALVPEDAKDAKDAKDSKTGKSTV